MWENCESVIIGRAQLAAYETDLAYCQKNGIPVVRRFTAGGAVYNGPGNLNWSIFVAREATSGSLRYVSAPLAIFRMAAGPVKSALNSSGVDAMFEPPNTIVTDEGKISGMAAYVSKDGFVCHGTLLLGANLERLKALTTPHPGPLRRRYTRSRDVRTANASVKVDSFIRTFLATLAEEGKMAIEKGSPDRIELELSEELVAARYGDAGWNLGDPFERGLVAEAAQVG